MKTARGTDERLNRAEAELGDCVRALFGRCPELAGFEVFDLSAEDARYSGEEKDPFAIQIDLSRPLTSAKCGEICKMISNELGELVSSQPDALELLRGRIFTRTLQ
ncbi:MAG: hypothetical protein HYY28_00935 [Betaproteobacteria bacterium]|nr:hypothetical protein [Betaproteobacteria bacterium]MBI2958851.1 hypothetical protein [Betaproteobacteria bacterium]